MPINIDRQKVEEFGQLELLAKQAVEGFITGLHKSPFHGFSVEFAEHRLYNNGESTRHIDWKLYARSEKLFIKRYEEETNLRCRIVLDHSASMFFPQRSNRTENKILFSAYAAAALTFLMRKQRDAVGLTAFAEEVDVHTPAKSSSVHHSYLFKKMEELVNQYEGENPSKTFAVDALHEIAESIHKRSLVIIFSDMLDNSDKNDELFAALQHLRHNKHEVILFHVMDKEKELEFNYDNRPYTFIDMETGKKVKVNPASIRKQYRKSAEEYQKQLKLRCGQYRIDYVEADINQGFNQVLLQYLIKRKKMR